MKARARLLAYMESREHWHPVDGARDDFTRLLDAAILEASTATLVAASAGRLPLDVDRLHIALGHPPQGSRIACGCHMVAYAYERAP